MVCLTREGRSCIFLQEPMTVANVLGEDNGVLLGIGGFLQVLCMR